MHAFKRGMSLREMADYKETYSQRGAENFLNIIYKLGIDKRTEWLYYIVERCSNHSSKHRSILKIIIKQRFLKENCDEYLKGDQNGQAG